METLAKLDYNLLRRKSFFCQLLTLHVDNDDDAKPAEAVGIEMVNCEVGEKLADYILNCTN